MTDKFKNARVLVRDSSTHKMVSDTHITTYYPDTNQIEIYEETQKFDPDCQYSVLILYQDTVYEYMAKLRKDTGRMSTVLALYGEHRKEDRSFARYDLKAEGIIDQYMVNVSRVELKRPIKIRLENISGAGVLITSDAVFFRKGDRFHISVNLGSGDFGSDYELVRSQNSASSTIEYGCKTINEKEQSKIIRTSSPLAKEEEKEIDFINKAEETSGYLKIIKKISETGWYEKAIDEILTLSDLTDKGKLMNFIHRRRSKSEKKYRNCVNDCIMFSWVYQSLFPEDFEGLKKSIKSILEIKLKDSQETALSSISENIYSVVDQYDQRASFPMQGEAGIPFGALEQMWNQGKSVAIGNPRFASLILSKYLLESLIGRECVMKDGSICLIQLIPSNDISHPIVIIDSKAVQLDSTADILWLK